MLRPSSISIGRAGILLGVLAAWELAGRSSTMASFLVGTPSAAAIELAALVTQGLHRHVLVTAIEALVGLTLGTGAGTAIGLGLWFSPYAAGVARPFVLGLGTLPVIALAPMMIVWFGIDIGMKIALATLSTIFPAIVQAYRGGALVSREYVDVLVAMGATRRQVFIKAIVPGSLDWVFSSMRLNVGLGLLGAFLGEYIASDSGLGFLITRSASLYNTPRVFAALTVLILLALALDITASFVERYRGRLVEFLSVPKSVWKTMR